MFGGHFQGVNEVGLAVDIDRVAASALVKGVWGFTFAAEGAVSKLQGSTMRMDRGLEDVYSGKDGSLSCSTSADDQNAEFTGWLAAFALGFFLGQTYSTFIICCGSVLPTENGFEEFGLLGRPNKRVDHSGGRWVRRKESKERLV